MKQCRHQPEDCQSFHTLGEEKQRTAQSQQNYADIFDAVIGQQPFDIMLRQRIKDAQ